MSDLELTTGTVEAIAELTRARLEEFDLPTGRKVMVNNEGTIVEIAPATKDDFGIALGVPRRIKRVITLQDAASLTAYIVRFKGAGATIFADIDNDRIVAVLDYHVDSTVTANVEHVAILKLPRSEEWKTWAAMHDKMVDQLDFARFIEENGVDIEAPDAADILECCKDLFAVRNADFRNVVRTNTDALKFEYSESEDIKSNSSVEVPKQFVLRLPVYFGGESTELRANLRWRAAKGEALKLGVFLSRFEYVRQAVFKGVVDQISSGASVDAFYGSAGNFS